MAAKQAQAWPTVADVRRLSDVVHLGYVELNAFTLAIAKIGEPTVEQLGHAYILLDHVDQAIDYLRDEEDSLRETLRSVEVPELDRREAS